MYTLHMLDKWPFRQESDFIFTVINIKDLSLTLHAFQLWSNNRAAWHDVSVLMSPNHHSATISQLPYISAMNRL